ncbi:MAG: caspase family protein, partial [Ignavibacteria bacterium]|nr:caspase family protein [Ignavibacteria bacterium]
GGTKSRFASMQVPPSTIIAYACAEDAIASSMSRNGRNSLYTYHLLRHIRKPNIDIKTVLKFVGIDVQNESEYHQIPFQYSSCKEKIYLGMNALYKRLISPYLMQKRPIIRKLLRIDIFWMNSFLFCFSTHLESRHRRKAELFPIQHSTSPLKHFNKQLYSQHDMPMNHHHSLPRYSSPYKTRVPLQYDPRFFQNVWHH